MGEMKNKDTKTAASQAWRRKPRKFAPKSRLGCKTCKIRRVKCDLSLPSCLKCHSTGRTCDGYSEMPLAFKTDKTDKTETTEKESRSSHSHGEKPDRAKNCTSYPLDTTTSAYQPKQWHAKHHGLTLRNLRPCMILPVNGPAQADAMCFFECISIKHLNAYNPCESWRKTLVFFSQTVPSVRYAAIALALIHRNYLDRDSSDLVHQPQSRAWLSDNKAPLLHYNRAIQSFLSQTNGDSTETTTIALLVCYLLTCFDHLVGNYVQAVKHLRGGVEISRNINIIIINNNNSTSDNPNPSGLCTFIRQVTRQIRRLDIQAVSFLVDWTPGDIQETRMAPIPPSCTCNTTFHSLEQAADHLQILVAQVMRLCNTEQQLSPMGEMPPLPSSLKDIVLGQLETWLSLFEQGNPYTTDPEAYPLASLLRLQHTIAWILLRCYGPGREMAYDDFLPQFQQCVAFAGDVAAAHERYSGSLKPTFTPEVGIIPVLYMIGVKCRHPVVRREVLGILRRQRMREAVWDSISAARVVERVIEIEESGTGDQMVLSMEEIAVWQRVEALSWVHGGGQSAARLDITYTFCAREGLHIESLVI
ncbi:hypothetical protein BO70DRAFT_338872 [Aspergillus heteromorphus CBS 117.55]|uniref:Zn(2)-C6 fungal-type domain-containing protein n=1 Tax=Aspergillus heteromorphus CBS 117.55 TaxID=1448321 RepID=A0A317VYB9_9EURO|nr:uncharacterized protein BO70DRAFT_338872 [Aspergillus heteromorphus CBS 117.55]PWY78331.1 hypothetical protein BO70DRAFT_338872 [Aspergillus heteromorphus CBS 117.55]